MNRVLDFFEKYGLLIILLNCFALLPPDLSTKAKMMDLNLADFNAQISGGNLKKQVLWIVPFLLYLLAYIRSPLSRLEIKNFQNLLIIILLIFLVFLCSGLITTIDSSFIKRFFFQCILVFVLVSALYFSLKQQSVAFCLDGLFFVMLFFAAILIITGNGFVGAAFAGWAKSKNTLGGYMLSAMLLLWYCKNHLNINLKQYHLKLGILFFLLLLSASKTSILLGLLILLFSFFNLSVHSLLFTTFFVVLVSSFVVMPSLSDFLGGIWNVGLYMSPDSLTGRGIIWQTLYYDLLINDKFLQGYGYGQYFSTGAIPDVLDDPYSFMRYINSAHNGYLEILLQFGGFFSLILMILLYKFVVNNEDGGLYFAALIVFFHNIFESSFFRDQHIMWVTLILLFCASALRQQHFIATAKEVE